MFIALNSEVNSLADENIAGKLKKIATNVQLLRSCSNGYIPKVTFDFTENLLYIFFKSPAFQNSFLIRSCTQSCM